jgi:hypothetical protein
MDTELSEEPVLNVALIIVVTVLPLMFVPPVLKVGLLVQTVNHVMHVLKVVLVVPLNVSVYPVSKLVKLLPLVVVHLMKLGTLLQTLVAENFMTLAEA